jgi:biotin synthase
MSNKAVKKIRISLASAAVLGLNDSETMIRPTTLYLLHGDVCSGLCSFCPMSCQFAKKTTRKVSRVTWPEVSLEDLERAMQNLPGDIKRICLQCVRGFEEEIIFIIEFLSRLSNLPISVSVYVRDLDFVERLVKAGAQRIGIAVDAANQDVFSRVKKGDFHERLDLIRKASERFTARITSHIIVGMGETEKDVFDLLGLFYGSNVTTGLFAFTPVRGTDMQDHAGPDYGTYRRLQLTRYLFHNGMTDKFIFSFDSEERIDISLKSASDVPVIDFYNVFRTSGCPGCNRPFYNESPGKRPYNFSCIPEREALLRELESLELTLFKQLNIFNSI